jgi:tetratricopeptide (TPR) repeat protein
MSGRKVLAVAILLIAIGFIGMFALNGSAAGKGPPFVDELPKAERIVVASPNETAEVPAGGELHAKIERVLRGSGAKGDELHVAIGQDVKGPFKFDSRRQYVLFLAKNKEGEGWRSLGAAPPTFSNSQVIYADSKGARHELPLDEVKSLIAKHAYVSPAVAPRTNLEGDWVLVFSDQGTDIYGWVLTVAKGDQGAWQVNLKRATEPLGKAGYDVKSSSVTEGQIEVALARDEMAFAFSGQLDKGTVYGALSFGERGVMPARLLSMDALAVDSIDQPQPAAGNKELEEAFQTKKPLPELEKFIESFTDSPLVLDAQRARLMLARQEKATSEQASRYAESYLASARRWGPVIETKAHVDIGVTLAKVESLQELALKHLEAAESKLGAGSPTVWKLQTRLEKARLLIAKEQTDDAATILNQLHENHPHDFSVTYTLAALAEKQKHADGAIELYAELVATPLAERSLAQTLAQEGGDQRSVVERLPSRALTRLWTAKHGDTDGLTGHLDEVYHRVASSFVGEKVAPRETGAGNRIALLELFTGAECPPCVAADLATGGLEATYERSEVIVLRYHEHIPGPDPLANDITQARFGLYEGQGTPTLILNGIQLPNAGGYVEQTPEVYKELRKLVTPILEEKSDYSIELSATASEGKVSIRAKATAGEAISDSARLVLVLTEDKVPFLAGNGIRSHEMIVRSMPAGVEGQQPADGKLEFSKDVDLAKLRASLNDSLARFEKESGINFNRKPMDLKKLHLVAFVQDAKSKAVLQAAAIPVAGDLETAGETETPPTKDAPGDKSKSE